MFAGSYPLSIDEKGRMAIPARFRQKLGSEGESPVVITMGPNPCLEIYPDAEFGRLAAEIQAMPDRRSAELLKQYFIGLAVETEIDKQGRVLLPPLLRKRATINGAAVLVGQITRFDVWSESLWTERFGDPGGPFATAVEEAFRTLTR